MWSVTGGAPVFTDPGGTTGNTRRAEGMPHTAEGGESGETQSQAGWGGTEPLAVDWARRPVSRTQLSGEAVSPLLSVPSEKK